MTDDMVLTLQYNHKGMPPAFKTNIASSSTRILPSHLEMVTVYHSGETAVLEKSSNLLESQGSNRFS